MRSSFRRVVTIVAVEAAQTPGTVNVTGNGFTAGGWVYVALYDRWGAKLYETRWLNASATVFGPDGSQDPAAGFVRGGAVNESFANLCDAQAMVRAYDQQSSTWSNWSDVATNC